MLKSSASKRTVSLPASRHLALRLLSYEVAADGNSGQTKPAPWRVLEKLRPPLCTLAGVDGFRSLLSRALALARAEASALSAVDILADGSLRELDEPVSQTGQDNDTSWVNVNDAGTVLIGQLLGLLFTFIGEALTLRLLQEIWPDAALDGSDSVGREKLEHIG